MIDYNNPIKSYFDAFILLLVGYSCITSLYNSAFTPPTSFAMVTWNWIVEGFFYFDLIFSFFHAYHDPDHNMIVKDFRSIAKHYLSGWFIIDLVAVFPFG